MTKNQVSLKGVKKLGRFYRSQNNTPVAKSRSSMSPLENSTIPQSNSQQLQVTHVMASSITVSSDSSATRSKPTAICYDATLTIESQDSEDTAEDKGLVSDTLPWSSRARRTTTQDEKKRFNFAKYAVDNPVRTTIAIDADVAQGPLVGTVLIVFHTVCVMSFVLVTQIPNTARSFMPEQQRDFITMSHKLYCATLVISNFTFSTSLSCNQMLLYCPVRLAAIMLLGAFTALMMAWQNQNWIHCPLYLKTPATRGILVVLMTFVVSLATTSTAMLGSLFIKKAAKYLMWCKLLALFGSTALGLTGFVVENGGETCSTVVFLYCFFASLFGSFLLWNFKNTELVVRYAKRVRAALVAKNRTGFKRTGFSYPRSRFVPRSSTASLYRAIWGPLATLFLTLFVTYTVFPGIVARCALLFEPEDVGQTMACWLIFCFFLGDSIGTTVASYLNKLAAFLWLISAARLAYVPIYRAMFLTPPKQWNLWVLYCGQLLFGISNGIGVSVPYASINATIERFPDQQKAHYFANAYCLMGIIFGIYFMNVLEQRKYFIES